MADTSPNKMIRTPKFIRTGLDYGLPGWYMHATTLDKLMRAAVIEHIEHPEPDEILSIETHLLNVTLAADSIGEFKLDVGKDLWLNSSRWTRLVREYVDYDRANLFITNCKEILRENARDGAVAGFAFNAPKQSAKKHRWGGCLGNLTFYRLGDQLVMKLYSRTMYLGYMGMLDAGIVHVFAKQILAGEKLRKIAFEWHIDSMQLHCFKTLPYIYTQTDLYLSLINFVRTHSRVQNSLSPTWKYLSKWQQEIAADFKEYGVDRLCANEKYGPLKRVKRRWLQHMELVDDRIPPSLFVTDLTFDKSDEGVKTPYKCLECGQAMLRRGKNTVLKCTKGHTMPDPELTDGSADDELGSISLDVGEDDDFNEKE